jgi:hypothetical protein
MATASDAKVIVSDSMATASDAMAIVPDAMAIVCQQITQVYHYNLWE